MIGVCLTLLFVLVDSVPCCTGNYSRDSDRPSRGSISQQRYRSSYVPRGQRGQSTANT